MANTFIESLTALEWVNLIGSAAATMTALFTGYASFALWQDRKRKVLAEWETEISDGRLIVTCHITNKLGSTLVGGFVDVRGPVRSVTECFNGPAREKHPSWPAHKAPADFKIAPDKSGVFKFEIHPDPARLKSSASSIKAQAGLWLTKAFWQVLGWQVQSGPKFSIRVIARRRDSPTISRRLTHNIKIYPESAMNMAAIIEAKAATD